MNHVTLLGNITKEPEVRFAGQTQIANISIAVNKKVKQQDKTSFFEAVSFGKTAEFISKYFHKGSKILLEGELEQQTWQDKQTQKTRSKVCIIIQKVHFVDKAPQQNTAPAQAPVQPAPQGYAQQVMQPATQPYEEQQMPF